MAATDTFEQFLTTGNVSVNPYDLVISLVLAILLAGILGFLYRKFGTSLSNRKKFAGNFVLIAATTTLIITIVKSSLALSLGLVGALSIIRFRAAIKEPEELAYLFLVISIGLGLGANQIIITLIAFVIICLFILIRGLFKSKNIDHNLSITITSDKPKKVTLKQVTNILNKYSSSLHLKRFDSNKELTEASFYVSFDTFGNLEKAKKDIEALSDSVKITYLDRE